MIKIKGKYNEAVVYCSELEEKAYGQIEEVCNWECFKDNKIRIMPDVHAGMGCTIGTTMTITDKVVPGMVGVDIGCGMETVKLKNSHIEFEKLDKVIRQGIPSGMEVRKDRHSFAAEIDLSKLRCAPYVNLDRAYRSIGTLGGGNHFIEIDKDDEGCLYLVVHSGSRHLGNEVAKYYQNEGYMALCGNAKWQIDERIAKLKAEGREKEISSEIRKMKQAEDVAIPRNLAYVEGRLFDDYIHDMKIIQKFAELNRKAMVDIIVRGMKLKKEESFTTIHNYIDTDSMILRKGAISAFEGQKMLIPINMRDGSLICLGKGNKDWNYSAPHGAGRLMSRKTARESLSMGDYKKAMKGIFTTCVGTGTIDEAPMAYKGMDEILSNVGPTAEVVKIIKPVYNFKAEE